MAGREGFDKETLKFHVKAAAQHTVDYSMMKPVVPDLKSSSVETMKISLHPPRDINPRRERRASGSAARTFGNPIFLRLGTAAPRHPHTPPT